MFGWEFPPYNSGGLGVACQGLAYALAQGGTDLTFVLPKKMSVGSDAFDIIFADTSSLPLANPYSSPLQYSNSVPFYGASLFDEVERYGLAARAIARQRDFDIIHAHDWLSLKAGLQAKAVSGKPLVFHVHATEFDRTGGTHINSQVYEIEREGMQRADAVVAVSDFTKSIITRNYGIAPEKVHVVHNGINAQSYETMKPDNLLALKRLGKKIVLFVGRITLQKGPDYFLRAAKGVLAYAPDTLFIIAGSGDMEAQIIQQAASLGIAQNIMFAGFLRGQELVALYRVADVMLMPSGSEPFGIASLESLANGTPVILSKQSGASEVLAHVLKVDFWDVDEMVNKIVCLLRNPALQATLQKNGREDVKKLTWRKAARKCMEVYRELMGNMVSTNA